MRIFTILKLFFYHLNGSPPAFLVNLCTDFSNIRTIVQAMLAKACMRVFNCCVSLLKLFGVVINVFPDTLSERIVQEKATPDPPR